VEVRRVSRRRGSAGAVTIEYSPSRENNETDYVAGVFTDEVPLIGDMSEGGEAQYGHRTRAGRPVSTTWHR
jgi:hypothetical protein